MIASVFNLFSSAQSARNFKRNYCRDDPFTWIPRNKPFGTSVAYALADEKLYWSVARASKAKLSRDKSYKQSEVIFENCYIVGSLL